MGDVLAIIDNNGQEIVKYAYDAWGNHQTFVLTDDKQYELLSDANNDTNNAIIANLNPFRYRGYYYDIETKLYYLNSRYYDPETGRFINADNISILNEGKDFINGLNLYAYCGNNPVMNTDDSGQSWWKWLVGLAVIAVAAVLTVVTAGGFAAAGAAFAGAVGIGTATTGVAGFFAGATMGAIVSSVLGMIGSALITGISTGDWSWSNLSEGISTGFMWGAIGGTIGGAIGGLGGSKIAQGISQGVTQMGVYGAKTLSGNEKFTLLGLFNAGFAGFAGGSLFDAPAETQAIVNGLLVAFDCSIAHLKKGLSNTWIEKFTNALFGEKAWNLIW